MSYLSLNENIGYVRLFDLNEIWPECLLGINTPVCEAFSISEI